MKAYKPLIALILVSASAASALSHNFSFSYWMTSFMGIFLLVFALLKLFDIPGFAEGFQRYDLLAKRSHTYARAYPYLELLLALSYLGRYNLIVTYIATILLMSFGALGVFTALRKGLNVNCACMGTALNVPLSTVAVIENVGMTLMAITMLITG